MSKNKH